MLSSFHTHPSGSRPLSCAYTLLPAVFSSLLHGPTVANVPAKRQPFVGGVHSWYPSGGVDTDAALEFQPLSPASFGGRRGRSVTRRCRAKLTVRPTPRPTARFDSSVPL